MEEQEQLEGFVRYEYKADPKQEPTRIDKFLMDRMESITRNKVQNGIKDGWVTVNGKNIKPNHKVKPHDIVLVRWKRQRTGDGAVPEEMDLDIRYEDDDVLVIHKPAGLVVHPGIGNQDGTLVNGLAHYLKDLPIVKENNERPGIVHRIDKNTTGLMLVAKNSEALSHLGKQFFDHSIERKYLALVWGYVEADEGTIEGNIDRHPTHRKMRHVYPDGERGKHAVTHYKVIRRYGYVTLVECQLETGRTHQIRVHFKHIGHPLFNDNEYGGDRIVKGTVFSKYKQFVHNCFQILPHQALHAQVIGFVHPSTGKNMRFEAPLPDYFQQVLDRWERYTEGRVKK